MRKCSKLFAQIFLAVLCCLGIGGCSGIAGEETVNDPRPDYYDIRSEKDTIFRDLEGKEKGTFLGMQYFQGEPIQFWIFLEGQNRNVYLCRTDGSREQLEGIEADNSAWYMDQDGQFYCWKRSFGGSLDDGASYVRKLDSSGKEVFSRELEQGIKILDLCQLGDGSVLLLLQDEEGDMKLAELDPQNGKITEKQEARLDKTIFSRHIAAGGQGVLVLDTGSLEGISEISPKDGSRFSSMSFLGTSYSLEENAKEMEIQDFCMPEEGKIEILWANPVNGRSTRESLSLSKVEKAVITLRTTFLMDNGWLQNRISDFNRANQEYYVVLEYMGQDNQDEVGTMTAIQMATGKGPDILYEYALEYVYDLVEKGGFEDLAPYMKDSGIQEEDYFPYAFSCWRDGEQIITFRMKGSPYFFCIEEEILGGRQEPDVYTLVRALSDWEEDAALGMLSSAVVENFMGGSDDLWGMIDWDAGTCDFSGELFADILKVAKRYGDSWSKAMAGEVKDYPEIGRYIECSMYDYKTSSELEEMKLVRAGALFEDGCYPQVNGVYSVVAMNANSGQKQGAWEFISYLMSDEVQRTLGYDEVVNKAVFKEGMERELERLNTVEDAKGGGGKITYVRANGEKTVEYKKEYTKDDITEERLQEYLDAKEGAREMTTMSYMRLRPILQIIKEEAEYYYDDVKTLEEVIDIINNRANLYIGEQR